MLDGFMTITGRVRASVAPWLLIAAVAMAPLALSSDRAGAQSFDDTETTAIETIVRNYLLENPEVIVQAIEVLQEREEASAREAQMSALRDRSAEIFDSPASPVMGEVDGDVVLVEFFDYQCGYCARVLDDVFALSEEDDNLRVVFKELPILGPASTLASQAALAVRLQDEALYVPLHNALMAHQGQLSEQAIFQIAAEVGADIDQLRGDLNDPQVIGEIQANLRLAEALGIRGTPAFVIGDELIPGAIGLDVMRGLVDAQRSG